MIATLLSARPAFAARVLIPVAGAVLAAWVVLAFATDHTSLASFSLMWVAMSIAMMIPTTTRPMLKAANGSAQRAWVFLAGYVTVWLMAGVPAYALMNAITWTPFWIAMAWIAAGLFQVTPLVHQLNRSRSSVRFFGEPLSYGLRQGVRCVGSCAPVMLAVMVTAMSLPGLVLPLALLIALTVLLCWEKEPSTLRQALMGVGMAMILVAVLGVMVLGGGGGVAHLH